MNFEKSCAGMVLLTMFTVACSGNTDSPLAVSPSLLRWQLSGMLKCNGGDPIAGATLEVTDGPDLGAANDQQREWAVCVLGASAGCGVGAGLRG
jgi:hypothetical protein